MDRGQLELTLHHMIVTRLFCAEQWIVDREISMAITRKLTEMALQERVPEDARTIRRTPLGNMLNVDLLIVFMGMWDCFEVPDILWENGLIDDSESRFLLDLLFAGRDPERTLRKRVQQAYFRYYNPSLRLN
jgi:hypothetical protein